MSFYAPKLGSIKYFLSYQLEVSWKRNSEPRRTNWSLSWVRSKNPVLLTGLRNRGYTQSRCRDAARGPCALQAAADSPSLTWSGLNPLARALGAPHSVLIITLCRGWYQKSYPNGAASPGCSQFPTTSNVSPSSSTKPPERRTGKNRTGSSRCKSV